ncbi:MAG: hypothetical protein H6873_00735 [Hyphomicrobiaceae bacterium]|nr:hypothetical protein [Hyphomicrobiaceae bacterium]
MIPLQHIHPMIVHFPIVFLLSLLVFDTAAALFSVPVTGRSPAGHLSAGLAVLAALFAMVAIYFGDQALSFAEANGFESDIAEIHEHLAIYTSYALIAWALVRGFLWWRNVRFTGLWRFAVPAVELAGAAAIIVVAYFGGQLVFDLGVNVAHVAA